MYIPSAASRHPGVSEWFSEQKISPGHSGPEHSWGIRTILSIRKKGTKILMDFLCAKYHTKTFNIFMCCYKTEGVFFLNHSFYNWAKGGP
jgi:hypothetical protein